MQSNTTAPHSASHLQTKGSTAHTWTDDLQGFILGVFLTTLAITLLKANQQLAGGTAGISFVAHYFSGISLNVLFFLTNLPFLVLAWRVKGWQYAARAGLATLTVSLGILVTPLFIHIEQINPIYSALVGGGMLGVGCLALIRHNAPVGGLGIFCVLMQEKYGVSAGKIQAAIDVVIMSTALFAVAPLQVFYSAVGVVFAASVIAFNHKEGRYISS